MTAHHLVHAYGLVLDLPFPSAVLPPAAEGAVPDVSVTEGSVARHLESPTLADRDWELAAGRFLFRGGHSAGRFLVEGGDRVTLERNPGADDEVMAFFLLNVVMAAVLRRRGLLVLHANAAVAPGGAVLVLGDSGAGKSTTLAGLLGRGCALLSDDVTALRAGVDGLVDVVPGVPTLHLDEGSASMLGVDVAGLEFRQWHRLKAAVPAGSRMSVRATPLRAVVALSTHDEDDLVVSELEGTAKFAALLAGSYGPEPFDEHPSCVPVVTAVMSGVTVVRVERPTNRWTVDEVVDAVLSVAS